uniref:3CxxC-type domain-containing protein n=1 Tax=Pygocentrus nattereri TaxID=42514 RepID=A0AAR2KNA8_PYGNA
MATYGDESLDSYLYSSYNPYSYRCPKPKAWRQKSYQTAYSDGESYLDSYHRAQLKSILSQINPNLTPRLRKANTRDVAVQVNPKADASVQCSLGPRTLIQARRSDGLRMRRTDGPPPGSPKSSSGGAGGVRFPRTQAVYSPIASRGLAAFLQEDEDQEKERGRTGEEEKDKDEEEEEVGESKESKSGKQAEDELSPEKSVEGSEQTGVVDGKSKRETPSGQEEPKAKSRVRFQVYFKQFCRTCQKSFNPYRVEDITCQSCKKARCTCPGTARHVDPKRPHRQDLCGRCKGKRLSCDSTFSFKYII